MLDRSSIFALAAIGALALAALAPTIAAAKPYQASHAFGSLSPHPKLPWGGICGWGWVAHHLTPIHC